MRNLSSWSIRNPVIPIVLFLALTIAGLMAFSRLEVQNQPDIDFPVVIVSISQPGAAPSELENQVTQRVEAALRQLQGIQEINSSVSEGNSTTWVDLAIGTPIDRAVNDARDAIMQIRSELPDGILEPQIMRRDTSDDDLASYAVVSTSMTLEELSWYVDNEVSRTLLSIPGMGNVERTGGVSREIRVILDPARLQAQGLTAGQVNQQLRQVNLNAAGGRAEIAGSEQSVRVLGNAGSAYELGQTQISVGGGRTIRLADIAEVRDLYAEQRSYATQNGQQVLTFSFGRAKGHSDVSVYDEAIEKLDELQARSPDISFVELSNSVRYTKDEYSSAMTMMVEGAFLAIVVVFLFLRDWRATIIAALAIPLSAIPTFWFMELMGFTLNSMTLLSLSLVAGVLVDDAIVEIENIVRHMRMGKSAYQASIEAADEIGLAVVATSLSIVAIFLPVGMMPGVAGQFFKNFGFTVVAAVLVSLAVARMITPMFAAYFLKPHGQRAHGEGRLMDLYMGVLRWTLKHRWVAVLGGAAALALTMFMFMVLPQTFQPTMDRPNSTVTIEMVPGTTLAQTGVVAREVERILREEQEVESIFTRVRVGSANVTARLVEERERTSIEFERAVAPRLAQIPDARASFRSQFGGMRDLTITLASDDPAQLAEVASQVVEEMASIPEIVAPRVAGDLQRPEILIRPRLDLAAQMGVTTSALSQAIRVATLGDIDQNSARFSLSDRQIPIRVALDEDARQRLSTIENMPVPTTTGDSVPLRVIAEIGFGAGPTTIQRTNQTRRVNIGADLAPGVVTSQAQAKIDQLPTMQNLPLGVSKLELGMSRWQAEMISNFMIAVVAGLLLVLAVLILLYKRFMAPFVNMASLLLAPLGGLLVLWAFGMPISLPVYIGMLLLIGIVGKNSILLIDFALEEMERGVDKMTAIIDAGHKRAQPIVMTTIAMSAGMVPTALSLSGDGAFRQPMAVTVIGGLFLSTVLTLVIVPACFSLALGAERRLGRLFGRALTYRGPEDHGPQTHVQPAE